MTREVEIVKIKDVNPDVNKDFPLFLTNANGLKKQIYFENLNIENTNPIKDELEHFANCIVRNLTPKVSLKDGAKAMQVAHQIISKVGKIF